MNHVTRFSDQELEQMLHELESDLAERKGSLKGDAPKTIREAVCAFANDLPDHKRPGVVFVGVGDDGTPTRLSITDALLLQLADIKTDGNILPPPTMTVSKHTLLGAEVAVVTVQPSDSPPVRYKGRIFVRTGSRRGIASAQDERMLNEKRRHRDKPFDIQPLPSAVISDLDHRLYEESYLPSAFAPDILAANDRSYEQRLAATKMIVSVDDPTPTVLGILVLASRTRDFLPGAYIQFLRIAGSDFSNPIIDEQVIDGAIGEVIHGIDEKLGVHNWTNVNLTSGPVEQRKQPYPRVALQQLVRNAVLHRTYEATNTPVRIYWYDNRIEILSPGGPFGIVSRENFGQPGVTDYRNPNLAEALRVLGFVQRFGAGIQIARQSLKTNGNPIPDFDVQPNYLGVTLWPAP